ncbi:hypothetical protein H4219_001387 [Mycoemilia scoparia]|uniref:FYR N-terminal domain-containing protein n=1 Tax=Mycoemilia scoparia TaxID=417184 RepID=A0A9W8DVI2_9FUNG|nr:hypothetical protein H4219_001387 [Mycoemilia scoparia]
MASDLTEKVNAAIKKREQLLEEYNGTRKNLRKAQQDNDHLLDLLMKLCPDIDDGLWSSDDSIIDEGFGSDVDEGHGKLGYGEFGGTGDDDSVVASVDEMIAKRRSQKQIGGDVSPSLTKKRRRQGKRDDRRDPKPIEELPKDESGQIVLPASVGRGNEEVIIHNLGEVVWDRENYHTSRYIWPVGFKSVKIYPSMIDRNKKISYISEIIDGGDTPIFQVRPEDQPDKVFTATSSSGVWKLALDEIMSKGVGVKTHASGPQMYGLSNLAVTKAIQELPDAEKCSKYVMQQWISKDKSSAKSNNKRS